MNTHPPLSEIVPDKERLPVLMRMPVGVLAGIVCAMLGCRGNPDPPARVVRDLPPDQKVMLALDCYNPIYQIDENGRIFKLKLVWLHLPVPVVAEIGKLTAVRSIDLAYSTVNDEGLAQLTELQQLRSLGLGGTAVTDRGLLHLEKLPSLQYLWLSKKSVTPEGVERLKAARPDINVYLH